jgi:pyruvate formate lyase activating enzyme
MNKEVPNANAKEARWWRTEEDGRLRCTLCPRDCRLADGQVGFCFIRLNQSGVLYTLGYGRPAAVQVDPIEKKPLFHFYPGTRIFSMGTAGCNMGCSFCQNWDLSKARSAQVRSIELDPARVVQAALQQGCRSLAFTYNEPTIWAEYVVDISRLAHEAGLKTVMVTNGYISKEAFPEVYEHIDAANVDLKAFTESFYARITLAHLAPVLETLRRLRHETGVWIEITNLIIPALNDSADEIHRLCDWVVENLGDEVPLHFTAFHPDFKLRDRPPTPARTLQEARGIAHARGLKYVYEGNVLGDGSDTFCPSCSRRIIRRSWHHIEEYHLVNGRCPCGTRIAGHFE